MFASALDPESEGHPHEIAIVDSGAPDDPADWFLGAAQAGAGKLPLLVSARLRGRFGEGARDPLRGRGSAASTRIVDFGFSLSLQARCAR